MLGVAKLHRVSRRFSILREREGNQEDIGTTSRRRREEISMVEKR